MGDFRVYLTINLIVLNTPHTGSGCVDRSAHRVSLLTFIPKMLDGETLLTDAHPLSSLIDIHHSVTRQ